MRPNTFTISRLAAAADVHVETVRYYQRRKLLHQPARPSGGVRRYDESDVNRLRFIRHAQMMGFSLDEIAGLLQIPGEHSCEQTRQLTERKLVDIRLRIRELRNLERDLEQKVARCAQVPAGECCPTLNFLGYPESGVGSGSLGLCSYHFQRMDFGVGRLSGCARVKVGFQCGFAQGAE